MTNSKATSVNCNFAASFLRNILHVSGRLLCRNLVIYISRILCFDKMYICYKTQIRWWRRNGDLWIVDFNECYNLEKLMLETCGLLHHLCLAFRNANFRESSNHVYLTQLIARYAVDIYSWLLITFFCKIININIEEIRIFSLKNLWIVFLVETWYMFVHLIIYKDIVRFVKQLHGCILY